MSILDTGIRNARNVNRYVSGQGTIRELDKILSSRRSSGSGQVIFLVDEFFEHHREPLGNLPCEDNDQ